MTIKIICKRKDKYNADFIYNKRVFKCFIGFGGIGRKLREGDGVTPQGIYTFDSLLYREDRVGNIKSPLRKIKIKKYSGWSSDPKDKHYNTIIKKPYHFFHEDLYRRDGCYDLILCLNFNLRNPKKYKGSAIFLHCLEENRKFTEGCIAIEKIHIIELIKKISKTSTIQIK
tara:strand:+ start:88 stop:600 length:513 start_codon:yes stop_codon:yes gene_type:complete